MDTKVNPNDGHIIDGYHRHHALVSLKEAFRKARKNKNRKARRRKKR